MNYLNHKLLNDNKEVKNEKSIILVDLKNIKGQYYGQLLRKRMVDRLR